MKRFLAIFAMVAMIVSMFSGVAFAALGTEESGEVLVYVQVDNDILDYGKGFNTVTLSGKIFNSSSNALEKIDAEIKVYKDVNSDGVLEIGNGEADDTDDGTDGQPATPVATVTADDGTFSVLIQTDSAATGVANYIVVGTPVDASYEFAKQADALAPLTTAEIADAQDQFSIVNKTELSAPATFEYTYPVSGQQVVQGNFVNEDGDKDNDTITIAYQDAPTSAIATANFHDAESFGFLFNGSAFNKVGKIGVYINNVLAVEGEVKSADMEATATEEITTGLDLTETVTFDFNLATDLINSGSDCLADDYILQIGKVTKPDDTEILAGTLLVDDAAAGSKTFADVDKQTVDYGFDTTNLEAGTYVFTLELVDGDGLGVVTKTVDVEVELKSAASYNLINWDDSDLTIGTKTFTFGTDILVKDKSNVTLDKLEVVYEGAGLEKTTVQSDDYDATNGVASFNVTPKSTGTLTITINVYGDIEANDTSVDYSFTRELEVKGWNVEVSPQEVLVDTENTFTITVTDEEGNPVNNADIEFSVGGVVVDSSATNVVGGVYTYEDAEFTSVGKITVYANKSGEVGHEVTLTDAIEVLGEEVYTVTSDTPVLLNGLAQDIYVTVLDENGDVVYPSFSRVDVNTVDGDDNNTDGANPTVGSRKDLDGDGVKEAVLLTVTATDDQHTMIIRATTDGGKKMGEVKVEVKKPQVVFTKSTKLTQNILNEFEFTVVDPRDNSVMDNTVTFVEKYFAGGTLVEDEALSSDGDVWTAKLSVKSVNWDTAEDDEKTVEAKIMMGTVELQTVEVVKPSLTANPETVIINAPSNITLTYTDANGNPLAEREIKLDDEVIGETNEDGQVTYATSATSSLSLEFKAATDVTNVTTDLKVKATADTQAPVVSAPETVTGNTVVITIKDNVQVSRALINGEPVEIYFPMPEVSHIANVKPGVNTFNVQVIDVNNNYSSTDIVVTVEKTTEPVTFTIGEATEYGAPELKSETTMVPVRFAEDLGATVAWDNATQTVTYKLGENEISMTIGSSTAIVNGVNTQLAVAPYLNTESRTMVPLRMIAQELGFTVNWTSNDAPISIE